VSSPIESQNLVRLAFVTLCACLQVACPSGDKGEAKPAASDAINPNENATPEDMAKAKRLCAVSSASPEHVSKVLDIGSLERAPVTSADGDAHCVLNGSETVTLVLDDSSSEARFSDRRRTHDYLLGRQKPPRTENYPKFGDAAFSQTVKIRNASGIKQVVNTLVVLKGKAVVSVTAPVPLEQIQPLVTDLLKDLGAKL
jgi:hypothetical protein